VIFDDTSHFALWQDPDTFNRAMVRFLTEPSTTEPVPWHPVDGPFDDPRSIDPSGR